MKCSQKSEQNVISQKSERKLISQKSEKNATSQKSEQRWHHCMRLRQNFLQYQTSDFQRSDWNRALEFWKSIMICDSIGRSLLIGCIFDSPNTVIVCRGLSLPPSCTYHPTIPRFPPLSQTSPFSHHSPFDLIRGSSTQVCLAHTACFLLHFCYIFSPFYLIIRLYPCLPASFWHFILY